MYPWGSIMFSDMNQAQQFAARCGGHFVQRNVTGATVDYGDDRVYLDFVKDQPQPWQMQLLTNEERLDWIQHI